MSPCTETYSYYECEGEIVNFEKSVHLWLMYTQSLSLKMLGLYLDALIISKTLAKCSKY